jgi:xylulokinase
VFELPVEMPVETEGAAFGAALQALWAWRRHGGDAAGIADLAREHVALDAARAAQPRAANVPAYREPYRQFLALLEAEQHAHGRVATASLSDLPR